MDLCHKNGIKVIFDGVFNHSGDKFFAFRDVVEKGEKSKYANWYFINSFPVQDIQDPIMNAFPFMEECRSLTPEILRRQNTFLMW